MPQACGAHPLGTGVSTFCAPGERLAAAPPGRRSAASPFTLQSSPSRSRGSPDLPAPPGVEPRGTRKFWHACCISVMREPPVGADSVSRTGGSLLDGRRLGFFREAALVVLSAIGSPEGSQSEIFCPSTLSCFDPWLPREPQCPSSETLWLAGSRHYLGILRSWRIVQRREPGGPLTPLVRPLRYLREPPRRPAPVAPDANTQAPAAKT